MKGVGGFCRLRKQPAHRPCLGQNHGFLIRNIKEHSYDWSSKNKGGGTRRVGRAILHSPVNLI